MTGRGIRSGLRFGAKYVAEDEASYLLYSCDRAFLGGNAVSMERLARFLGLDVRCEYLCGDCICALGTVTFEPQRVYTEDGALDLTAPAAIVERDVIEKGESGLYNFTLAVMCAEMLSFAAAHETEESGQLSFGLDAVASKNRKEITLQGVGDELESGTGASDFALKLALPKVGFKRQTMELYALLNVNRATLDEQKHLPFVLATLAQRYNVPEFAVLARMRELNL